MELNKIYQGDVLDVLRTFPNESVHCCVTSPPYWGLRDYGSCGCAAKRERNSTSTVTGGNPNYSVGQPSFDCEKCDGTGRIIGTESQLGLEKTPEEYVAKMVEVFREVRRVLRKDGTLWLNLGDSFSSGSGGYDDKYKGEFVGREDIKGKVLKANRPITGLPPKNLIGIPWRVAFALQADGWYLRQDIIWGKPNPMPESVQDRPTKSHEYIFLMSKSPMYYYDAEAIKESAKDSSVQRLSQNLDGQNGSGRVPGKTNGNIKAVCGGLKEFKKSMGGGGTSFNGHKGRFDKNGREIYGLKVNKRSVWYVTKQPFKEAHFATFPPKLIEPCVKAGTSEYGACPDCGCFYGRVVEKRRFATRPDFSSKYKDAEEDIGGGSENLRKRIEVMTMTNGWNKSCEHPKAKDVMPCVVLDPFMGAGTTALVAKQLGRNYVGIELNAFYIEIANRRIQAEISKKEAQPELFAVVS